MSTLIEFLKEFSLIYGMEVSKLVSKTVQLYLNESRIQLNKGNRKSP